ncbi:transmembrane protein 70, mitochondrial isoform X2 [Pempheris klunzingeri]|uniref:transmembrane protein 70, mitochondrial isoform X2 n=1 Tax=Pempheris klunzingeri TaxID=3127111 RepID=UPI0039813E8E
MLSANALRSLSRSCVVSRLFGNSHRTVAARGAPASALCLLGGGGRQQLEAARSCLHPDSQLLPLQPSVHCSSSGEGRDRRLVYSGTWGSYIRWLKVFSYSSSALTLGIVPQIALGTGAGVDFTLQALVCGAVGLCAVLTPVFFHLITKGYVLRLYHSRHSDTYAAVTVSVFLTEKTTEFHQSDVRVSPVSKIFTTLQARGTGLLLFPDGFQVHDYNHLMGYDKPFSFPPDDPEGTRES